MYKLDDFAQLKYKRGGKGSTTYKKFLPCDTNQDQRQHVITIKSQIYQSTALYLGSITYFTQSRVSFKMAIIT